MFGESESQGFTSFFLLCCKVVFALGQCQNLKYLFIKFLTQTPCHCLAQRQCTVIKSNCYLLSCAGFLNAKGIFANSFPWGDI